MADTHTLLRTASGRSSARSTASRHPRSNSCRVAWMATWWPGDDCRHWPFCGPCAPARDFQHDRVLRGTPPRLRTPVSGVVGIHSSALRRV